MFAHQLNYVTVQTSVSVKRFLFFKDFVDIEKWSHIDIAGVMDTKGEVPYLPKGMAGTAPI